MVWQRVSNAKRGEDKRGEGGREGEKKKRGQCVVSLIRNKRKCENREFMAVKRCVLGRTGCGEEVMLMWQDLTCWPGGLIFFDALGRNQFCW